MTQYGNVDITLDVIRGIDAIRRGAHALSRGIRKTGHICVLMSKIETDILRLSHIRDTPPGTSVIPGVDALFIYKNLLQKYMNMIVNMNTNTKTILTTIMR